MGALLSFFLVALTATALLPAMAWPQASRAASAQLHVPAVLEIRRVGVQSPRGSATPQLQLVAEVTTAANVGYVMTVVGTSALSALERRGFRVSVQNLDGTFAPMHSGELVVAARGQRGAASITEVVVRLDVVPDRAHAAIENELRTMFAFQATVESSSGETTTSEASGWR